MWYWDLEIVELASLGYPFLPLQLQPLVGSFYYWNMLTYSRTNRSITFIEPMFRNRCGNRITATMRGKSHGALGIRNIAMEVIPLVFMEVHSCN